MNLYNTLALYEQLKHETLRRMRVEKIAAKIDPKMIGYLKHPLSRVAELAPDIARGDAFLKAVQSAGQGATASERAGALLRNLRMLDRMGVELPKTVEFAGYVGDDNVRGMLHLVRAMKEFVRAKPSIAARADIYRMFSRMNPQIRHALEMLNDYKRLNRAIDQKLPFMRPLAFMQQL